MAKVNKKVPRLKDGTEFTSELEEVLSAEAERGYDLTKATMVRIGRPSLGGDGPSPRLSFRTSPELFDAVQRRAEAEHRSVSDLAREAVARFVNL
jgi:hypothetical protein